MKIFRGIKIKLGITMFMIFVLMGCSNDANTKSNIQNDTSELEVRFNALEEDFTNLTAEYHNKISLLESELDALRSENNDLQYDLMLTKQAINAFPSAWPAVQTFVEAYFALDLDTVRHMLSDKYTVHEESISFNYEGEDLHMPHTALIRNIDHYQLNSFGYPSQQSSTRLFFQVMTYDENSSGFINLYMLRRGHEWIVDEFEFDI